MVRDFELTDVRLLPFFVSFPRNVSCWHYPSSCSWSLTEKVHVALVVANALPTSELALVACEADAFQFRQVRRLLRREATEAS